MDAVSLHFAAGMADVPHFSDSVTGDGLASSRMEYCEFARRKRLTGAEEHRPGDIVGLVLRRRCGADQRAGDPTYRCQAPFRTALCDMRSDW